MITEILWYYKSDKLIVFITDRGFSFSGHTITRPNSQSNASITRWPWELIVSYVRSMGEICTHGKKSRIQRDALMGCRGNEAGLLQFLKFQLPVEEGIFADACVMLDFQYIPVK